jgi:hypothetical protein
MIKSLLWFIGALFNSLTKELVPYLIPDFHFEGATDEVRRLNRIW